VQLSFITPRQRNFKFPLAGERGNALILILVAVGLFAALSYAVMKDSKGGLSQSALTTDQARLIASALIQYGDSLRPIVDKMLLMNGVLDTDSPVGSGILFDPPGSGTAPLTRELFEATGGNAPYITPPATACNSTCSYVFSGQYTLTGVGTGTNPDLSMLLVNVPQSVCQMINYLMGLGTTIPTGTALTTVTPFNGTNYGAATAVTLTTSSHAICYQESSGAQRYIYVNVIRAR